VSEVDSLLIQDFNFGVDFGQRLLRFVSSANFLMVFSL